MNQRLANDGQIRHACRRGIKELDVLLETYLTSHFKQASHLEKQQLINLLELNDYDLLNKITSNVDNKNILLKKLQSFDV